MNEAWSRQRPGSRQLLARVLEQPDLLERVQALEPTALRRLIDEVGLADAGELVALATTEQIVQVFDDDLWKSERPGEEERFDAERFALWLEVLLEAGDAFVAARLVELPEELVTLALHRQVLVLGLDDLRATMADLDEDDAERTEKALGDCLYEELDEYQLVSRRHDTWDAVLSAILALDRDHHEHLVRILERCRRMSEAHVEESGGLYEVLTAEEMLEADVAGDRADRRAASGHVAPTDAAAFLASTGEERDPITRAYLREVRPVSRPSPRARAAPPPLYAGPAGPAGLAGLAGLAGVEERLPEPVTRPAASLLEAALRISIGDAPDLFRTRSEELAYLANVLVAGATLGGRRLRPIEATRVALATTSYGLELRGAHAPDAAAAVLRETPCDVLFRAAWRSLASEPSERSDLKMASAVARATIRSRTAYKTGPTGP